MNRSLILCSDICHLPFQTSTISTLEKVFYNFTASRWLLAGVGLGKLPEAGNRPEVNMKHHQTKREINPCPELSSETNATSYIMLCFVDRRITALLSDHYWMDTVMVTVISWIYWTRSGNTSCELYLYGEKVTSSFFMHRSCNVMPALESEEN